MRQNNISSIRLYENFMIIESDKGTRIIKDTHPHYQVYRDNILSMGLTLYEYEDKVKRYVDKSTLTNQRFDAGK